MWTQLVSDIRETKEGGVRALLGRGAHWAKREGSGPRGERGAELGHGKREKTGGPKAKKGEGKKKKFLLNFLNTFSNQIQFKFKSF